MSDPAAPTKAPNSTSFGSLLNGNAGAAVNSQGQTINTLLAAIAAAAISFGVQVALFYLLRIRLKRIYRPKTYLVPDKERVSSPPKGLTPNIDFIRKCGLDAYFFLRYLRMLLKIFLPTALILLPILLPLNRYSGDGNQLGLDVLSISNVAPRYAATRLWAHLIMAIGVVIWVCYVIYKELRGYIRIRQAYLTSPQHRIRASATTVLVTGVPRKWLTEAALNGLYDVFPGGIRNIWINRNFDTLAAKVGAREAVVRDLESAETALIRKCKKAYMKTMAAQEKKTGIRDKKSKSERKQDLANADAQAQEMAQGDGVSAGDQQHAAHDVHELVQELEEAEGLREEHETEKPRTMNPLAVLERGVDAVGHGFGALGRGVENLGRDATRVVRDVNGHVIQRIDAANGTGFAADDDLFRQSTVSQTDVPTAPPQGFKPRFDPVATGKDKPLPTPDATRQSQDSPPDTPSSIAEARLDGIDEKAPPKVRTTRPSANFHVQEPSSHLPLHKLWQFWRNEDRALTFPSPQPHTAEEGDQFPLHSAGVRRATADLNANPDQRLTSSKWAESLGKLAFWKKDKRREEEPVDKYPPSYDETYADDNDTAEHAPLWSRFIEPKDRETIRERVTNKFWLPRLPFVGKKIDKIHWLRKELARLNVEIEQDQSRPEDFPLMNSAFIQFNHQVAAHMACQCLSHHIPQNMAPRVVEISPRDVVWDNMSIKWWERYLRTALVWAISVGLIILYAIPVSITSFIAKANQLAHTISWLAWIATLPGWLIAVIQGLVPPLLLTLILLLVPLIFGLMVRYQGVPTGKATEMGVQDFYFLFLFIQVFFVVTLSGGLTSFFTTLTSNPTGITAELAQDLPKAANYFFSYLFINALSNSAGALLQTVTLLMAFLWAPIVDSTPRQKWARETTLQNVAWGAFFPPFTNFAVIGLIYSVIAPFMLVFMLIIFSLFWIVYRYNVLYVYSFRNDTGGLLFPRAVNQLFTGLYVLELCLIGIFFLARDPNGNVSNLPHAIVMIVVLLATIAYQVLLNDAFQPLFRYLPITLEDEAVIRDEEYARAKGWVEAQEEEEQELARQDEAVDVQDRLEEQERREEEVERFAEDREKVEMAERRRSRQSSTIDTDVEAASVRQRSTTHSQPAATSPWHADRWRKPTLQTVKAPILRLRHLATDGHASDSNAGPLRSGAGPPGTPSYRHRTTTTHRTDPNPDIENQKASEALFSAFADELEDLNPAERDVLVDYAFLHAALRAKRPVVWIPRDELGVSDDEVRRTERMSRVPVGVGGGGGDNRGEDSRGGGGHGRGYGGEGKSAGGGKDGLGWRTNIWISNEGTALDGRGNVVFRRSPPDFDQTDLIDL
ncbi:hypothetical protein LTR50_005812 [Elasticomyces elasticus]|nr:hypothetical protein LTR50_005812 [Elasticomyces elasticus]